MSGVPGIDVAHALGGLSPLQDGIDPSHVAQFEQHAAGAAQRDGATMTKAAQEPDAAASPAGNASAMPAAFVPGVQAAHLQGKSIGHQVLDGLERFGRSLSEFNTWGHRRSPLQPAMPESEAAPGPAGSQGVPASNSGTDRLMAIEQAAEQEQARTFATELDVEVAIDSSGALMKSLKSLLTQGGG